MGGDRLLAAGIEEPHYARIVTPLPWLAISGAKILYARTERILALGRSVLSRSRGQHISSFDHVLTLSPCRPWTNTILCIVSEYDDNSLALNPADSSVMGASPSYRGSPYGHRQPCSRSSTFATYQTCASHHFSVRPGLQDEIKTSSWRDVQRRAQSSRMKEEEGQFILGRG